MVLFLAGFLLGTSVSLVLATSEHCDSLLQVKAVSDKKIQDHTPEVLNETETQFISGLLSSYGKQKSNYVGKQALLGFRSGSQLMDEQGMFAFDNITSVAIDIGAANNPLIFDMDIDTNQMVLAFEPIFAKQLGEDLERAAEDVDARGGCKSRWESHCVNQRLVVIPAAVSSEVGYATFHLAANPYCGSLNSVPSGSKQTLMNHHDKEVRDVMNACWGSLTQESVQEVPTITLASVLRRIPKHIRIKYIKIDAQGQDYKILMGAGDQMSRIEYVRFEMQVDPPAELKMVQDIPSYAEVESKMKALGFVHKSPTACSFDGGSSPFSKAIQEKECVFCRELPCKENGVPPFGPNPRSPDVPNVLSGVGLVDSGLPR
jgi:FkbM family methyltransferase